MSTPTDPNNPADAFEPPTWPGWESRRLPISWDALCHAFELEALDELHYLDTETGETLLVNEESLVHLDDTAKIPIVDRHLVNSARRVAQDGEARYLEIESRGRRERRQDVESFTATVVDPDLRSRLEQALAQPDAVGAFRTLLASAPAESRRWLAFRRRRVEEHAVDWLRRNAIQPINALTPTEVPPSEPLAPPTPQPPVAATATPEPAIDDKLLFEAVTLLLLRLRIDDNAEPDGRGQVVDRAWKTDLLNALETLEQRGWITGRSTSPLVVTPEGGAMAERLLRRLRGG